MLKRLAIIAALTTSFMVPSNLATADTNIITNLAHVKENIQEPEKVVTAFERKTEPVSVSTSAIQEIKVEPILFQTRIIENENLPSGIRLIVKKGAYGTKTFFKAFKTSEKGNSTYPFYYDEITSLPVEEVIMQGIKTEIISGVSDKTIELETEKAAESKRIAEEAAAAKVAAEKLEKEKASSTYRNSNVPSDAPAGSITTPAENRAFAKSVLSAGEFECADKLVVRESEWKTTAENKSSGAYGVPQSLPASKLASAGADWRTNGKTQFKWMMSYVSERYGGSFCTALNHSYQKGWY